MRWGRCSIPTARRFGNRDGCRRLRPRHKVLDGFLRGGQRRGIERGGGIVAFAARIPVALSGCQRKPFVGLCDVFLGAKTARH